MNPELIEIAKILKIRTNMDENEYNYFLSHYSVDELKEIFKDILKQEIVNLHPRVTSVINL